MIRARIPRIASLIARGMDGLEAELDYFGRPVGTDAGVRNILKLPLYFVPTSKLSPFVKFENSFQLEYLPVLFI